LVKVQTDIGAARASANRPVVMMISGQIDCRYSGGQMNDISASLQKE
jgi:hypothetical protein